MKLSLPLCFFSALLLILSFPSPDIEFFAWFGLVPLLFAIEGKKPKEAFLLSYFTGLLFFSAILYWLVHVSLPGLITLVLYLGLYFGVFGLLVSIVLRKYEVRNTKYEIRFLFIPCLWVALEFLRTYLFTGFGWALLGYSQYLNLPLIQISDITGVYGVSFLIVLINVSIYSVLGSRFSVLGDKKRYLLPVLFLAVTLLYGYYRLHRIPEPQTAVKISLIQGNIPQDIKWDEHSQDFIVNRYDQLTRMAAVNLPQLIIWPETAVPVYPAKEELLWNKVLNLARDIKIPLLVGVPREVAGEIFNSAALISGEGEMVAYYDKLRLVPFGEYIPLGNLFSFVKAIDERAGGGDFSRGQEYTVFEIPLSTTPVRFGVLICFESIFPHLSRGFVRRGANFLVNITNEAWFGKTAAPYQHAQASVFRAVENRVPLVRSANTGLSCFIDSRGRIISRLTDSKGETLFITGHKTAKIHISSTLGDTGRSLSFYRRFGDIFAFLCIIIFLKHLRFLHSKPS